MRMGINDFSSHEVITNMSEKNLNKIFKFFGDEKIFKKKLQEKLLKLEKKK